MTVTTGTLAEPSVSVRGAGALGENAVLCLNDAVTSALLQTSSSQTSLSSADGVAAICCGSDPSSLVRSVNTQGPSRPISDARATVAHAPATTATVARARLPLLVLLRSCSCFLRRPRRRCTEQDRRCGLTLF